MNKIIMLGVGNGGTLDLYILVLLFKMIIIIF